MQGADLHLHAARRDGAEVALEEAGDLAVVLIGHQAHRNLRRGLRRDHRLGPLADVAAPNAVDVERGADARAFDGRVARLALDVADRERTLVGRQAERRAVEGPALGLGQLAHVVVEARNGDVSVLVDQTCHQTRQHVGRIGHRTAEEPRVEVLVGSRHLDFHVGQAAQAAGDRGSLHRDHRGVRDEDDVGLEQLLVAAAEVVEALRADLLLALEHEFHVAGQRARRTHRLEGLGVHPELALVVVGAASPDAAVYYDRLEGLRAPLLARVDGHDVVVSVDKHGLRLR